MNATMILPKSPFLGNGIRRTGGADASSVRLEHARGPLDAASGPARGRRARGPGLGMAADADPALHHQAPDVLAADRLLDGSREGPLPAAHGPRHVLALDV